MSSYQQFNIMVALRIDQIFMTLLVLMLQSFHCVQGRSDPDSELQMCKSGSIDVPCSWAHERTVSEQSRKLFSFNQCVGLNYDFSGFFRQACMLKLPDVFCPNLSPKFSLGVLRSLCDAALAQPSFVQPQPCLCLA
jgi:hypothetical protein